MSFYDDLPFFLGYGVIYFSATRDTAVVENVVYIKINANVETSGDRWTDHFCYYCDIHITTCLSETSTDWAGLETCSVMVVVVAFEDWGHTHPSALGIRSHSSCVALCFVPLDRTF